MNKQLKGKMSVITDTVNIELTNKLNSKLIVNDKEIPRIFHLVWIGIKSLSYMSEICIKSIRIHNPDYRIVLHHTNTELPNDGIVQSLIKDYNLECNLISNITNIQGVELNRVTGQSDLIRLLAIYLYGGIYIDLDIVILKSFEPLLQSLIESKKGLMMGFEAQHNKKLYINNGLIIGKKRSFIIEEWLNLFASTYSSSGWSEHGVELITKLYNTKFKNDMVVMSGQNFHPISWKYIEKQLLTNSPVNEEWYSVHLFNKTVENVMNILDKEREGYLKNNNLLTSIIYKGLNQDKNKIQCEYEDMNIRKIIMFSEGITPINIISLRTIRYHNPYVNIVLFSPHKINQFILEELNIQNIVLEDKIDNIEKIKFYLLYNYGGLYLDLDIICLQSLTPLFDVYEEQSDSRRILVCKELSTKGYYVNDGMILCNSKNNIIHSLLDYNNKFASHLSNIQSKISNNFILLSNLNFNPINYWVVNKVLISETINKEILTSSFGINLFAKTSKIILDEALNNKNSFLNYIIDIGLGNKQFYNINKFEETVNYINLKHRPERKLFFIATWSRLFTNLYNFEAIKTKGNINGCGKSHHTIVQNSTNDYCLVLEDDAIPTKEFTNIFPNVLEYVKNNINEFDLLTLASPTLVNGETKTVSASKINDNLIKIGNCSSSHFIIYTKSILPFFDKFYYELENNKTKETNQDWYFNMTPQIRKIITYPFLSLQYFGFCSDVVNITREQNFFKKGEIQIQIIKENLDNGITEDIYKKIHKKYMF